MCDGLMRDRPLMTHVGHYVIVNQGEDVGGITPAHERRTLVALRSVRARFLSLSNPPNRALRSSRCSSFFSSFAITRLSLFSPSHLFITSAKPDDSLLSNIERSLAASGKKIFTHV